MKIKNQKGIRPSWSLKKKKKKREEEEWRREEVEEEEEEEMYGYYEFVWIVMLLYGY